MPSELAILNLRQDQMRNRSENPLKLHKILKGNPTPKIENQYDTAECYCWMLL